MPTGSTIDNVTSLAGSPTITVTPSSVVPIGPGAFSDFVVSCTPTAAGQTTATLTLGSTDVDEPVNTYNVVCNAGAAPEPELTSLPVSGFPISLIGLPQSNVPASIGVTNVGNFTLRLLSWLSPAFPTGGFAYSHGIEWAVETGDITDLKTLVDWLTVVLRDGSGLADATFCAHAHRAVSARDTCTGQSSLSSLSI